MSEGKGLSRRDFLKRSAKVVALGIATGGVASEVITIAKENPKVELTSATFYPLYEDHNNPVKPSLIPLKTNYFYKEVVIMSRGINTSYSCSSSEFVLWGLQQIPDTQSFLAQHNMKFVNVDVLTPDWDTFGSSFKDDLDWTKVIAGVGASSWVISKIGKGDSEKTSSRRKFLRSLGKAALGYAGLRAIADLPLLETWDHGVREGSEELSPIDRLLIRANALQLDLHPEGQKIFFRNLIWAHKLLTLAEEHPNLAPFFDDQEGNNNSNKPVISMEIGAAHGGIEDMLKIGKENINALIVELYKPEFIKEVAELNGGLQSVASIVVATVPRDLGDRPSIDEDLKIKSRLIIDSDLYRTLVFGEYKIGE